MLSWIQNVKQWLSGGPKTIGYQPMADHIYGRPRDLPVLTHQIIRQMLYDPTIQLGLLVRSSLIASIEFAYQEDDTSSEWISGIKAEKPEVADWVHTNLKRIWKLYIDHLTRSQVWGWAGGEVTYRLQSRHGRQYVDVHRFLDRHARDVRVITDGATKWGVQVSNVAGKGKVLLKFPHAYFTGFFPTGGSSYGIPIMDNVLSPWLDKSGEKGAKDVRRLFMIKDSYGGMDMTYPDEMYDYINDQGEKTSIHARKIAEQLVQQATAGSATARPYDADAATGKNKWELERAKTTGNADHILQYPKDLDVEELRALGIPDDVIISVAGATGAWAGKQVPMEAFFWHGDYWAGQILSDLVEQILEPGVLLNFGRAENFEVETKPLLVRSRALESTLIQQRPGRRQPVADDTSNDQPEPMRLSTIDHQDIREAVGRVRRAVCMSTVDNFSFALLPIEDDIRSKILDLANTIAQDDLDTKGREADPHITLLPNIHSAESDQVRHVVRDQGDIAARVGEIIVLDHPEYDVVVLGIDSQTLHDLHYRLEDSLPNTPTFDYWRPHITLAYVKKGEGEKYTGKNALTGQVLGFNKLIFSDPLRRQESISFGGGYTAFSTTVN